MRKVVYLVLVALLLVLLVRWFTNSLFFNAPQRLQIAVYGEDSRIYSIDTRGSSHYIIHFAPDEKLNVPGGYGLYRVGALGKLVDLEKTPDIFLQAFSAASSTFVPYYFYPAGDALYYGRDVSHDVGMPTAPELLTYSSNANIFDRIYLFVHFLRVKKSDYLLLRSQGDSEVENDVRIFVPESFSKETEGYLFNPTYRREKQTVQIIYTNSYNTANKIANILEGNGIRVVDITHEEKEDSTCRVVAEQVTDTSRVISDFFNCRAEAGKSEVSDILLDIRGIEDAWGVE